MRNLLLGFLLALALCAIAFGGYEAYHLRKLTQASAVYLFSETEVKGKDGKPLSRADLIDALLRDAVQRAK